MMPLGAVVRGLISVCNPIHRPQGWVDQIFAWAAILSILNAMGEGCQARLHALPVSAAKQCLR